MVSKFRYKQISEYQPKEPIYAMITTGWLKHNGDTKIPCPIQKSYMITEPPYDIYYGCSNLFYNSTGPVRDINNRIRS